MSLKLQRDESAKLEIRTQRAYLYAMNENKAPTSWTESLDRSKEQIEAGQAVPMEGFLDRLRASIARMETRLSERVARKA